MKRKRTVATATGGWSARSLFTFYVLRFTVALCIALCAACSPAHAAEVDPGKLPPAATNRIDFARDIQPMLEASCLKCHGPEKPKSDFRLDNRNAMLRGGEVNKQDVIPGDSARSPLIYYVAGLVEDMEMPPKGKGEPLTMQQIALLRAWIDQGAAWSDTAPAPRTLAEIAPTLRWVGVEGKEQMFRANQWFKEGWNGGVESFTLEQKVGEDSRLIVTGRALVDDYAVALTLNKADGSYVNAGWQQYRKWYNNLGGFYQPFPTPIFGFGDDLHLDIGKAWLNAGMTLSDGTQISAGYEYNYRDGQKSSTEWLPVTESVNGAARTRQIVPRPKEIDESTHSLLLGIAHEWERARVQDNLRFDFYDLGTTRTTVGSEPDLASTNSPSRIKEGSDIQSLANAFKFQVQPKDWLLLSAGYLYTHQDGDSSFQLTPTEAASTRPVSGSYFSAPSISLEQSAQVVNANAQLTPWKALNFSGGVQVEWNNQSTFGSLTYDELDLSVPPGVATNFSASAIDRSDISRFITEEQFGVRFTQIPFTVLYGDVRFRQENYDRSDSQDFAGDVLGSNFERDTKSWLNTHQYRGGFNVSPWTRAALNAFYLHRNKQNDYDTSATTGVTQIEGGYPGFIQAYDITTDEVGVKLTLRPASWLKTTLGYSIVGTDYEVTTQAGRFGTSPGGTLHAGSYDAQVYSINATINPWRRLYLFATFSYSDARTVTADNGNAAIVPYEGHTYSLLTTATYVLSEKTDLLLSYNFSNSDYAQNNAADGLPLGLDYQWHQLRAGVSRRLFGRVGTRLDYVWYFYREPTSGDFNNYTGNGIFATVFFRWP